MIYASAWVPEVSFLIGYYTQIPVRLSPTGPVIIHFYLFYKPDYQVSAVRLSIKTLRKQKSPQGENRFRSAKTERDFCMIFIILSDGIEDFKSFKRYNFTKFFICTDRLDPFLF